MSARQPLLGAHMDGLLDAVWLVDTGLKVCAANPQACQMLGCSDATVLLGRDVLDLADTPEDVAFWEGVREGDVADLWSHTWVRRMDGQVLPVERRVSAVQLSDGTTGYMVALRDRSHEQHALDQLELSLAELRATLDSSADGILVCDLQGQVRSFNHRFAQIWAIPSELLSERQNGTIEAYLASLVTDAEAYRQRLQHIEQEPQEASSDTLVLRNGCILERVGVPQLSRGAPVGRVYSFRDITEQVSAQGRLQLAAKVFESTLDAVFIAGADGRLMAVNPACERLTRGESQKLMGRQAVSLFALPDDVDFLTLVHAEWAASGYWEGEVMHRRCDGTTCLVQLSWIVLRDADGRVSQSIGLFRDLTEQRAARQRIEQLAYTDALTGLPNRLMLANRVHEVLYAAQSRPVSFAILFLDLDRFKNINDSLGHAFGDRVLIQVAERLRACMRDGDILCRLGGDEFVAYVDGVNEDGARRVGERFLQALTRPFNLDEFSFTLGGSIGISMYPQNGTTLDELIKQADTAMYQVKGQARGGLQFYEPEMSGDLLERMKLESAMRAAMEQGRFEVHYQPQLRLSDGRLVGAEALLRWMDHERGPVPPSVFIPLAEESGYIVSLGAWVVEQAVRQAAQWYRQGTPITVAVNVSAMQFRQPGFVQHLAGVLSAEGLPAQWLELELTESILVQDADEMLKRLRLIASMGVQLSIDDFGTGYSSLAYLKKLSLHKLKIDQSFVRGLPSDDSDLAIVIAMLGMAKALKLTVIAEGVETEAQRELLQRLGCHEFQGYLFSPAVPPAKLAEYLAL